MTLDESLRKKDRGRKAKRVRCQRCSGKRGVKGEKESVVNIKN